MDNTKIMMALQILNIAVKKVVVSDYKNYNINATEFTVLAHLHNKGKSKTQTIGEVAFISSGAITYTVNKFSKQGFLTRTPDENDKRIIWIELTKKGQEFYEDVLKRHTEYVDKVFGVFDDEIKESFYQSVRYFTKKIKRQEK